MPASVLLTPLFTQMLQSGSDIIASAHTNRTSTLIGLLNHGEIEFFLAPSQTIGRAPQIVVRLFASFPLVLRGRGGHPLQSRSWVTWDEVQEFPTIGTRYGTGGRDVSTNVPAHYEPVVSSENYHVHAEVVAQTDALCAFLSCQQTPGLVDIACESGELPPQLDIMLVRSRGRRLSSAAIEVLKNLEGISESLLRKR